MLRGLWQSACLPGYELEKRLTEFHVVQRPDGLVTGAVGWVVQGVEGWVHSPVFATPALAAEGSPALWEHLRTLARAQGVVRLWALGASPFWDAAGFAPATPAQLKKRPAVFGAARGPWRVLALRDEAAAAAWEREWAAREAARQEEAERLRRRVAFWKLLAWAVAGLFFLGAGWLLLVLVRSGRPARRR